MQAVSQLIENGKLEIKLLSGKGNISQKIGILFDDNGDAISLTAQVMKQRQRFKVR